MPHARRRSPGALLVRAAIVLVAIAVLLGRSVAAQEHDHGRNASTDHGHLLHFSHPLVAESPSPDTKLRVDFAVRDLAPRRSIREQAVRFEGEYAFRPGLSVEVNAPIVWREDDGGASESGLGNAEVALKLASFGLAERGLLLGGGLEFELPTGSDRKGIGSSHLVELGPYVDAGYMYRRLELVAFVSVGTTLNRRDGEAAERELALSGSALYHITSRAQALVELLGTRALAGEERDEQSVSVAPGLKLRPFSTEHLIIGLSAQLPLTEEREYDQAFLLAAFYHF